jgi:hypothetical protein
MLAPTATFATASDYWGDEVNYTAVSSGPPGTEGTDYFCNSITGAKVCFAPKGDYLYVRDISADTYAAVAEWTIGQRNGVCVNNLGSGTWGRCDKDFAEGNAYVTFRAARYTGGNLVNRNAVSTVTKNDS